jgi:acyl carrier protein phosphodiesterase
MNHLAHLLLAEPTPESRLGNLAADYLRPMEVAALPTAVRRGVMQHRHIDGFTDRHPAVNRGIRRIGDRWGWFSGILLDVYFDHLLATNWAAYCPVPLRQFVFEVNTDLLSNARHLPDGAANSVRRIAGTDRLMTYLELAGVEAALARITYILRERIPERAVDLTAGLADLTTHHSELEADFAEFFPQLRAYSIGWLAGELRPASDTSTLA